jgi:hypothetical protein
MPIAVNSTKETLATSYTGLAGFASLHTADPGTTGTSEVTGGTYARVAITWSAGGSDGISTATVNFNVPASTATTHVGLQSASSGGTFRDKAVCVIPSGTARVVPVNLTYTQT